MTTLRIKVKPNSRTSSLDLQADDTWIASIKSPPVDGKANKELIDLVAKQFRCSKAAVSIVSGAGARLKLVRIPDP